MSDDPYPDVPEDAEGGDALVRVLSEMDESHYVKASALAALARKEWALYTQEQDGAFADKDFATFAEQASMAMTGIANEVDDD